MTAPRLGFLGLGWIGRHRMEALIASQLIEPAGFVELSPQQGAEALQIVPTFRQVGDLDALLDLGLNGLVIATPSALHAEQSIAALNRGVAVFCQKPLGRDAAEVAAVVDAARAADRLLGVDLSYRTIHGMQHIREQIRSRALGQVFAVDLVFHNAYGPDKPWFYDRAQSGGGCVIDLGVHLVDLALWALDFPDVGNVRAHLFANGRPLEGAGVEDYALATLELAGGTVANLACSWRSHAGCDAVISATFHGTAGGAVLRNINGSFYDFTVEQFHGTATRTVAVPPDDWGGRAAVEWAARLAAGERFCADADRLTDVAHVLDRIYAR